MASSITITNGDANLYNKTMFPPRVFSVCSVLMLASFLEFTHPAAANAQVFAARTGVNPGALPAAADIEVFVRAGCPHCDKAKEFLAALALEQPALRVSLRDVANDAAALHRLRQLSEAQGLRKLSVPAFWVNGHFILGFSKELNTGQLIRDELARMHRQSQPATDTPDNCDTNDSLVCETDKPADAPKPELFEINLFGHSLSLDQVGLPLFTLAMGLLDGFNPCSLWVLILMLSLLTPMQNRLRMFAVAGVFVAVEGIAYLIFMAAWLNIFLLIGLSRASEIIIAGIALLAGAINLKDFWAYGWGVTLSIPTSARPGIYARIRRIVQAENLGGAMIAAVVLAILVQIVEFLCTSGFPALYTRILTLRQMSGLSYYGYLLLYNAAYMLDDVIVLSIGIYTLSQRRLQEKEGRWLKLISGAVMVALGLYLLMTPN